MHLLLKQSEMGRRGGGAALESCLQLHLVIQVNFACSLSAAAMSFMREP